MSSGLTPRKACTRRRLALNTANSAFSRADDIHACPGSARGLKGYLSADCPTLRLHLGSDQLLERLSLRGIPKNPATPNGNFAQYLCRCREPCTQDQGDLPQEGADRAEFWDFTAVAALGTATESLKLLTDQFFNGGLRLVDRVQRRAQACDRVTPGAASRLCLQRCQVSARIHLPPVWIEQS